MIRFRIAMLHAAAAKVKPEGKRVEKASGGWETMGTDRNYGCVPDSLSLSFRLSFSFCLLALFLASRIRREGKEQGFRGDEQHVPAGEGGVRMGGAADVAACLWCG